MTLEEGLRSYLLEVPAITAFVQDRVFGLMRPQGGVTQLPAVLLTRTATTRQKLFCATDKLVRAGMQVDAYAMGGDAFDLADSLRKTLIDFRGEMSAVYVDSTNLANEFPVNDPDPGVIRMTQLYNFWYLED